MTERTCAEKLRGRPKRVYADVDIPIGKQMALRFAPGMTAPTESSQNRSLDLVSIQIVKPKRLLQNYCLLYGGAGTYTNTVSTVTWLDFS